MSDDKLLDLQHALKTYLDGLEYFSNASAGALARPISITTEDVGDLDDEVTRALGQAGGLHVHIRTVGGQIPSADTGGPVFEPAVLHLRVFEKPVINRDPTVGTYQPASSVADALIRHLWTFHTTMPGYNPVVPKSRMYGEEKAEGGEIIPFYDVLCEVTIALSEATPTRLPLPTP